MTQIAQFQCIIADSTSALKVSNHGAGKLTLEMDETQFAEVLKLLIHGEDKLITITAEVE